MRLVGLLILTLGLGAMSLAATSLPSPTWVRGIYIGSSPTPVMLPASTARSTAQNLARAHERGRVLVGSGHSMAPLYQAGTLMVVHPVGYDELQRGQTVVYRTANRQLVAHVLIAKARDGWRTAGLNNSRADRGGVRADNLVGVVVAAVFPADDTRVVVR